MGWDTLIERLYLRRLLTFDEVELEFDKGLVVLTGPSGAGKSVLISAILAGFGYSFQSVASLCEMRLSKPLDLENESYLLEEELSIKAIKKEKLRYLLEGQNISKKALKSLFSPFVQYLSVRDKGGFSSQILLEMIDRQLIHKDKTFKKLSQEYCKRYAVYKQKFLALNKIKEDEAKLVERIEYAKYEIEKIASINPQLDEEASLLKVKQHLSKIDKIKDALSSSMEIFAFERPIEEVYRLLDKDAGFFIEMMNQLRADFEETENLAEELAEVNIEEVLDRLSDLSTLKSRYGSIKEALAYKENKEKELLGYENCEYNKHILESFLTLEYSELMILSSKISSYRQSEAKILEKDLDSYLSTLKLLGLSFSFSTITLDVMGIDSVEVFLGESSMSTLSGGEFNRVRLALMAACMPQNKKQQGVLILDEIDANVSGDESIAIAKMIQKLSLIYQVFAISHQPHLSAQAKQHILVRKEGRKSEVISLDEEGRIKEIARIIAGDNPTNEALEFAKKLRP
jgi:DNA repair protein RecN (Recombination protein N)